MDQTGERHDLPCTSCGLAAATITAPELGAAERLMVQTVVKMMGAKVDASAGAGPLFGLEPAQLSAVLGVRCLLCDRAEGDEAAEQADEGAGAPAAAGVEG